MKKLILAILILICTMLSLSGCKHTDSPGGAFPEEESSDSSMTEESVSQTDDSSAAESTSEKSETGSFNIAWEKIPGGERLRDSEDSLFLLRDYWFDMAWMEVNQIGNLERGTPPLEGENHYLKYFLVLPKYVGSQIEVQSLVWDDDMMDMRPEETIFKNDSTPDDYGLVLTYYEPEIIPTMQVVVRYMEQTYTHIFSYDGRGDRPDLLIFPEDENWWERIPEPHLLHNTSGSHAIQMMVEKSWEVTYGTPSYVKIPVESEGQTVYYNLWFAEVSDQSPEEYISSVDEGQLGEIALDDGRTCYYAFSSDSPPVYYYTLEVEDSTVVLMVQFLEDIPDPLPESGYQSLHQPPHDAIPEFAKSLESIAVGITSR